LALQNDDVLLSERAIVILETIAAGGEPETAPEEISDISSGADWPCRMTTCCCRNAPLSFGGFAMPPR
jgi:hypothetical protein